MRGESGILPVMEVGNNGNNGGFGNNGDWAWIIVLFLIFGIGNRGFGNGGFGSGSNDGMSYILQTDFATLERKLDGVNNGLADGFYRTAEQVYGIQNTLCQGFSGVNLAITNNGFATQNAINGLSSQLASCCCGIEKSLLENRYLDAQNTCAITNAIAMNTRDIIDNANQNYRAIHEEIIANKLEMKNDRIAEQQNEINALRLKASQEAQNNYLVAKLGPKCPEPAYVVNGPTPVNFPTNCCNTFSGFNGCGNY